MILVNVASVNGLGRTNGCEHAPAEILKQLKDIYSNELGKEIKIIDEEIKINPDNLEETNKNIESKASELIKKDFCIFLGGDHSISYPLISSFLKNSENPGLIVFDSHADCVHSFKPPTHEDWLRVLIEDGFPPHNIILVGLRNIFPLEREMLSGINIFSCRELSQNIHEAADSITESARRFSELYVSIDIDAVDPAFAPATGYIEPAGLTSRELIYLLQRLKLLKNLKAADLVEINPKKEGSELTCKLGAKIIAELS